MRRLVFDRGGHSWFNPGWREGVSSARGTSGEEAPREPGVLFAAVNKKMTREDTTIVAPATPGGTGAISIVRLSGPDAFRVAALLTALSPSDASPRTLRRCPVCNASGEILDTALVVFFPEPHSFTGEDVVEIHLHGNPVVVETVVQAACAAGAVPAEPGEFSRRAFQQGKMDLTQAEGLCDLIAARTAEAARSALRQMRGGIREEIVPLRERLLSLLTLQEAAIDFAEEDDVPAITNRQLNERVSEIMSKAGGAPAVVRGGTPVSGRRDGRDRRCRERREIAAAQPPGGGGAGDRDGEPRGPRGIIFTPTSPSAASL